MGDNRHNFWGKSFRAGFTDGVLQGRRSEGHRGGSEHYEPERAAPLPSRKPNNDGLTLLQCGTFPSQL